jgi:hypothetical protein
LKAQVTLKAVNGFTEKGRHLHAKIITDDGKKDAK